jgi:hypothetical protein
LGGTLSALAFLFARQEAEGINRHRTHNPVTNSPGFLGMANLPTGLSLLIKVGILTHGATIIALFGEPIYLRSGLMSKLRSADPYIIRRPDDLGGQRRYPVRRLKIGG